MIHTFNDYRDQVGESDLAHLKSITLGIGSRLILPPVSELNLRGTSLTPYQVRLQYETMAVYTGLVGYLTGLMGISIAHTLGTIKSYTWPDLDFAINTETLEIVMSRGLDNVKLDMLEFIPAIGEFLDRRPKGCSVCMKH